jgi:hypothetical protein
MYRYLLLSLFCSLTLVVSAQDLYPFQDSRGKYGLKDENDKVIVQPKYDKINGFVEDYAAVNIGGKEDEDDADIFEGGVWGFINEAGKEVIAAKYSEVREFAEGVAPVALEEKWGYVDHTGKVVVPFLYKGAYMFNEGLAAVCFDNRYWGAINKKGVVVLKPVYSSLFIFVSGKAQVSIGRDLFHIDKTGKRLD